MAKKIIRTNKTDDLVKYGAYLKSVTIHMVVDGMPDEPKDIVSEWFLEKVVEDESGQESRADLYRSFCQYAGPLAPAQRSFFPALRKCAPWATEGKSNSVRWFYGLRLL